jgi:hypothetical protein
MWIYGLPVPDSCCVGHQRHLLIEIRRADRNLAKSAPFKGILPTTGPQILCPRTECWFVLLIRTDTDAVWCTQGFPVVTAPILHLLPSLATPVPPSSSQTAPRSTTTLLVAGCRGRGRGKIRGDAPCLSNTQHNSGQGIQGGRTYNTRPPTHLTSNRPRIFPPTQMATLLIV